jgi:hypothetical protein
MPGWLQAFVKDAHAFPAPVEAPASVPLRASATSPAPPPAAAPQSYQNRRHRHDCRDPGPVWSVAAFAQGFTAKGMPAGNRPIP